MPRSDYNGWSWNLSQVREGAMSKGQGKGGQSVDRLSRWCHENVETEVLEGMR